ncbi:hypothetical protein [Moorena producens]|uniref:hypothetical protein n=1 Tax=Moorena producens TaxID=1155739 RepID=UPI003C742C19
MQSLTPLSILCGQISVGHSPQPFRFLILRARQNDPSHVDSSYTMALISSETKTRRWRRTGLALGISLNSNWQWLSKRFILQWLVGEFSLEGRHES